jgi:hypothetical protein
VLVPREEASSVSCIEWALTPVLSGRLGDGERGCGVLYTAERPPVRDRGRGGEGGGVSKGLESCGSGESTSAAAATGGVAAAGSGSGWLNARGVYPFSTGLRGSSSTLASSCTPYDQRSYV